MTGVFAAAATEKLDRVTEVHVELVDVTMEPRADENESTLENRLSVVGPVPALREPSVNPVAEIW